MSGAGPHGRARGRLERGRSIARCAGALAARFATARRDARFSTARCGSRVSTARSAALGALLAAAAAAAAAQPAPPFDLGDEARIAAGKKRFGSTCAAYCHGSEGVGGRATALKGNAKFEPSAAYKVIAEGRRGTDVMPPWGNAFSAEQIWELVAYLRFLSQQPAP